MDTSALPDVPARFRNYRKAIRERALRGAGMDAEAALLRSLETTEDEAGGMISAQSRVADAIEQDANQRFGDKQPQSRL